MAIDILDILLVAPPFTLGDVEPEAPDVCLDATRTGVPELVAGRTGVPDLDATRTGVVALSASTEHARQCDGGSAVANAALMQRVSVGPGAVQLWTFTLPADDVPAGGSGIAAWTISVKFADVQSGTPDYSVAATITVNGSQGVTAAEWTITLDTDNLTGFGSGDTWFWTCWRTNAGQEEVLARGTLFGLQVVQLA